MPEAQMPEPPDVSLVQEAIALLQSIVAGEGTDWSDRDITLLRDAWRQVRDLDQPLPWRLSWIFFGWRYALKERVRQTGQQGRHLRLAEAIELDLQEHTIGEGDLMRAIDLMKQIPMRPRVRFRVPWTPRELRVIAAAIRISKEHPAWLAHDVGLQLDAAVNALQEMAALHVNRTDWQLACEVLNIDLREEAIIERGHYPLAHDSLLDVEDSGPDQSR
jgi:hypothetical protein